MSPLRGSGDVDLPKRGQWRLLPKEYGNWNRVYKRFSRWEEHGVWERIFAHFAQDPDMENGMIDSTIVRAHASAAGAPQKREDKPSKRWDAVEVDSAPKSM